MTPFLYQRSSIIERAASGLRAAISDRDSERFRESGVKLRPPMCRCYGVSGESMAGWGTVQRLPMDPRCRNIFVLTRADPSPLSSDSTTRQRHSAYLRMWLELQGLLV